MNKLQTFKQYKNSYAESHFPIEEYKKNIDSYYEENLKLLEENKEIDKKNQPLIKELKEVVTRLGAEFLLTADNDWGPIFMDDYFIFTENYGYEEHKSTIEDIKANALGVVYRVEKYLNELEKIDDKIRIFSLLIDNKNYSNEEKYNMCRDRFLGWYCLKELRKAKNSHALTTIMPESVKPDFNKLIHEFYEKVGFENAAAQEEVKPSRGWFDFNPPEPPSYGIQCSG